MKDEKIIDAEFTVVGEEPPRQWNGVGLPPEWPTWGLLPRLTYIAIFGSLMTLAWLFAQWLAHLIVPLR